MDLNHSFSDYNNSTSNKGRTDLVSFPRENDENSSNNLHIFSNDEGDAQSGEDYSYSNENCNPSNTQKIFSNDDIKKYGKPNKIDENSFPPCDKNKENENNNKKSTKEDSAQNGPKKEDEFEKSKHKEEIKRKKQPTFKKIIFIIEKPSWKFESTKKNGKRILLKVQSNA